MERTSSFGEWIRRQRKALDLTQQGLAERVGCSTAAIKKIESDERRPSRQIAGRLADVLALPAGQLDLFLDVARGLKPLDRLTLAQGPITPPVPSSLPSGTVTFLFTDIEGSTRLWAQFPRAMKTAHARHDQILREAIGSNGGYVFGTAGDAFSAAFDTAGDALRAAVRAQAELQAESWEETPIRVRMGIHTGEAQPGQDGVYTGYVTLSHVQRLVSAASGGQVLLSYTSRELVHDRLPANVELRDLGRRQLKDWDQPEHIYQLVIQGLPAEFPQLKMAESFPHNLPLQLTSFIGREHDLAEADRLLGHARLLTLVGPGGIGKTRLSLQLAAGLLPSFAEGAWLVELAPVTDGTMLPRAIAAIFGLRELPNLPVPGMIVDYLRARPLLLILDNCEHLVEACAQLSDQLLHSCPQLKIIATSREPLGIAGENVYRVPPLSVPGAAEVTREAALRSESIQLFVERAVAANPKFELTDQNAADVAQVCRQLDGIPLALELAAARIPVFSPREIAAHLEERFKLLVSGNRTALERHRTLQALIDWSYDLLLDEERALFCQLSVFGGSFTFEAAGAVCSGLDVFGILPRLIDKSLVMPDEQAYGTRYFLIETICQYAEGKLLQAGESETAHRRHAEFFLKFAQSAGPHFDTPREVEWLSRLEAEEGNLQVALEWALRQDPFLALRLAASLYLFWSRRGYDAEGSRMLHRALAGFRSLPALEGPAETRERMGLEAKALNALGVLRRVGPVVTPDRRGT